MGNKQAKQLNKERSAEAQRLQGQTAAYQARNQPREDEQYNWAKGAQGDIYGSSKAMLDPKFIDQFGFGGGAGGGGGYTAPTLQAAKLALQDRWKNLESGYYDPMAKSIFDAQKGYNEFAQTGGWSPEMQSQYRAQIAAGAPEQYQAMMRQMGGSEDRGYNPAALARGQRGIAQGLGRSVNEGLLGMNQNILQGRQWGITGQHAIGGEGLAGLGNVAGEEQRIADFNEQERAQIANANAQAAASAANANYGANQDLANLRLRAYGMGLGGMQDIYNASPGLYNDIANRNLSEAGMTAGNIGQNLQQGMNYNPNRSLWDKAMQGINAASGLAGAFMTGGVA